MMYVSTGTQAFVDPSDRAADRPGFARCLVLALLGLLGLAGSEESHAKTTGAFFVAEQVTYDDNLFRLPANFGELDPGAGEGLSRFDLIDTLSAGWDGSWSLGRQSVLLDARLDRNRFFDNSQLSNTSGKAKLVWDWQLGDRYWGDVAADYSRALVGFANNRIFAKDLLSSSEFYADGHYQIGPRWSLAAGARYNKSSQSADLGRVNDFSGTSGTLGIDYALKQDSTLSWNYRHSEGRFPQDVFINDLPFDRNYHEDHWQAQLKYAISGKTSLDGSFGYLTRTYPNSEIGNFSGSLWRISMQWQPDAQTQLALGAWRDLTAYLDAQSNYFVTTGASATPLWSPTRKIVVSLALSWERQRYIGSNPATLTEPSRRDIVKSAQLGFDYKPTDRLEIVLSYRREKRGSNEELLIYDDDLANVGVTFRF